MKGGIRLPSFCLRPPLVSIRLRDANRGRPAVFASWVLYLMSRGTLSFDRPSQEINSDQRFGFLRSEVSMIFIWDSGK